MPHFFSNATFPNIHFCSFNSLWLKINLLHFSKKKWKKNSIELIFVCLLSMLQNIANNNCKKIAYSISSIGFVVCVKYWLFTNFLPVVSAGVHSCSPVAPHNKVSVFDGSTVTIGPAGECKVVDFRLSILKLDVRIFTWVKLITNYNWIRSQMKLNLGHFRFDQSWLNSIILFETIAYSVRQNVLN